MTDPVILIMLAYLFTYQLIYKKTYYVGSLIFMALSGTIMALGAINSEQITIAIGITMLLISMGVLLDEVLRKTKKTI